MLVKRLGVGALGTNCYVVAPSAGATGAVIDPGGDPDRILEEVRASRVQVAYVVNTHGHSDHVAANREVLDATGAKLVIGRLDAAMLADPVANISAFIGGQVDSPQAGVLLSEGDVLLLDDLALRAIHTPGHTQGSMSLLCENALFSGDTLFAGSVGRTDLPGGSSRQLAASLADKLLPLDNDVVVYPGHGESTTIGREKMINPFMQGESP